jgi:excisionase family DNA binding protein
VTINQIEASKRFGVSDRTIRRWERAGLIRGTRVRGRGVKLYAVDQLEQVAGLR